MSKFRWRIRPIHNKLWFISRKSISTISKFASSERSEEARDWLDVIAAAAAVGNGEKFPRDGGFLPLPPQASEGTERAREKVASNHSIKEKVAWIRIKSTRRALRACLYHAAPYI